MRVPSGIRLLIGFVVIVVAIGVGWWLFSGSNSRDGSGFRTALVERGDVRLVISATGTLRATTTVAVGSQVSGQVLSVAVDFNDRVVKGQTIATLDPAPLQSRLHQANADLTSARAGVNEARATQKNAEADSARKSALLARQLIARSDADTAAATRDQARARVASALAAVQQRQAALDNAKLDLSYTIIKSPVDGVILLRAIEPGQTVAASFQTPVLFQIAEDLRLMQIDLSVDEADVGQIRERMRVAFTVDAFPDRQFSGEVKQVRMAATSNSNVVSYPVVVQVDNADLSLLPGMTANAEIVVRSREQVLRVPNAALRFTPADADSDPAENTRPGGGRDGVMRELPRVADALGLSPQQRASFDSALAELRQRAAARAASRSPATERSGAVAGFGGGRNSGRGRGGSESNSGGAGPSPEAMRQRMAEALHRSFADFRARLAPELQTRWDAELRMLATARRGSLWLLVSDQPKRVAVRIGASDGSVSEVDGDLKEGDQVIIGQERPAP